MKRFLMITLTFGFLAFSGNMQAQVNQNKEKETTTTKVVVKGTDVETVVAEEVKEKQSLIQVEGTNQTNQSSSEMILKSGTQTNILVDDKKLNVENQLQLERDRLNNATIDGVQRGAPTPVQAQTTRETIIDGKKCTCVCTEKAEVSID